MADPTTVPGLLRRLRVGAQTPVADGTSVSAFTDSVLVDQPLTQATASRQPVYRTGGTGGQPYLLFDGVDDYLRGGHGVTYAQPTTLVVVLTRLNNAATYKIVDGSTSARQMLDQAATGLRLFAGASLAATGVNTVLNTPTVVTGALNNTASSLYKDGAVVGTGTVGTGSTAGFTLAGTFAASPLEPANIALYEVLFYGHALTDAERATVHTYVQDTYGIAVADYVPSGGAGTLDKVRAGGGTVGLRAGAGAVSAVYLGAGKVWP